MSDKQIFSNLAILYELNKIEFERKLAIFPESLRYYVVLASSIIGTENSKRLNETPQKLIDNSEEFVKKMLELSTTIPDVAFRDILENYLIETLKDELRFNCLNCREFKNCLDIENQDEIGELFHRRVLGEETDELKQEIREKIQNALKKIPHINADDASRLCLHFIHNYTCESIGKVFGRYADIATKLRNDFGINYVKIQRSLIALNMEFFEKNKSYSA